MMRVSETTKHAITKVSSTECLSYPIRDLADITRDEPSNRS